MRAPQDPLEKLVDDALASPQTSAAQVLRLLVSRLEGAAAGCVVTVRVTANGGAVTRAYHSSNDARELSQAWQAGCREAAALDPEAQAAAAIAALDEPPWDLLRARAARARVSALIVEELPSGRGEERGAVLVFAPQDAAQRGDAAALARRLAALTRRVLSQRALRPTAAAPAAPQQQSLFGVRGQASAPPRQQALFKPMARAAAAAPLAKLARSRPRALVVEDERAIGELVQRVVAKDGYEAALVLDPAEALRRLAADPSRYELLLLDLTLPGFDGCELARRARRLGVTGRIVVVSGLGEQHARARCAGVDVDAFVSKPFTPQALRAATGGSRRDADAV